MGAQFRYQSVHTRATVDATLTPLEQRVSQMPAVLLERAGAGARGVASRQHGVGRSRGGNRPLEGRPDHTGHCDPGCV